MKLIKREEIPIEIRNDERKVQKLLSHNFIAPRDSMVLFLSYAHHGNIDYHYHEKTEEIIIFPEGGKIEVNGQLYNIKPLDAILIAPYEVHGFKAEQGAEYKDIYIFAMRFPDNDDKIYSNKPQNCKNDT